MAGRFGGDNCGLCGSLRVVGGSRWLRASEGNMVVLGEGSEAPLSLTASLESSGFDLSGYW